MEYFWDKENVDESMYGMGNGMIEMERDWGHRPPEQLIVRVRPRRGCAQQQWRLPTWQFSCTRTVYLYSIQLCSPRALQFLISHDDRGTLGIIW